MNKFTVRYTTTSDDGPVHRSASIETDDLDILNAMQVAMTKIHESIGFDKNNILFRSIELDNPKEAYERIAHLR